MKKIIISGGYGFLGRNLMEYCLDNRKEVRIFAIARHEPQVDYPVTTVLDDLSDAERLATKLIQAGAENADAFFHTAWNGVAPQHKGNIDVQLCNIKGGVSALQACNRIGCERFINIGTVAEYVEVTDLISADCRPCPGDMYGATKIATHYILESYARMLHQPYIKAILASTYGEYRNDDNVISYTIKSLLTGAIPSYGSLQQMWDFIYVKDAAKALCLIAEKGISGKTYGIGSGCYAPLRSFIGAIKDSIDPSLKLDIGAKEDKYKKILNSCVNNFALQQDTGFVPDYSFSEGIKRTIAYFQKEMGL